jgi:hypothetical protein
MPSPLAKRPRRLDSRAIARKALLRLMEPLAGFVFDSGLSMHEMTAIFREAAVRSVAAQQRKSSDRLNISGIAASTGISRAEISRILKSPSGVSDRVSGRRQQSTHKVLEAWQQNPRFTGPNGQPADLKLYGRGASFDALVKKFGGGIPTRAMLDELTRTGAIEIKTSQVVRMKSSVSPERGLTPQVIKAFGDRARELLSTLLQNMREPRASSFVASASGTGISQQALPLVRKDLAKRAERFLAQVGETLVRNPAARRRSKASRVSDVSITVLVRESSDESAVQQPSATRRNYKRHK